MAASDVILIDYLPRLSIRALRPFLREARRRMVEEPQSPPLQTLLSLNNIQYTITFASVGLSLRWMTAGKEHTQLILLYEIASPMGGSFYNFLCPATAHRCTVLYATSDGYLYGRRAFGNFHYRSEYEKLSRKPLFRALQLIQRYKDSDPHRRWGKEHYKGRLTAYGRRLQRYDRLSDECFKAIAALSDTDKEAPAER